MGLLDKRIFIHPIAQVLNMWPYIYIHNNKQMISLVDWQPTEAYIVNLDAGTVPKPN